MKKLLFVVMAMMLSAVANAQELSGIYYASDEYQHKANKFVDEMDLEYDIYVKFGLFFVGSEMDLIVEFKTGAQGVDVEGQLAFMGDYVKTDNRIDCTFSKDRISVSLQNLTTDDPDMRAMLENEESMDYVYGIVEGMMEEVVQERKDELFEICQFCKSLTLVSQSEDGFTADFGNDIVIDFVKLKN